MAAEPATQHELWIWPLEEFVAANEAVKKKTRTDIITITQLAQSGQKIARQVTLLGATGMAYVKEAANGKKYIIFKGNPALRPDLSGTRYLRENPKVSCFVIGTKEIIEDTAKGTKIAVIAFVAIDVLKECLSDRFSLASLGVNVASDVLQAAIGAGISIAVGAFVASAGAPVIITFAFVVGVGAVLGILLSSIDSEFKITERARAHMMLLENTKGSWLNRAETALSHAGSDAASLIRGASQSLGKVWVDQQVNPYLLTAF